MPTFEICNADKQDGGLTLDELNAPKCLLRLTELAGVDSDEANQHFKSFDTDSNGKVTIEELMNFEQLETF